MPTNRDIRMRDPFVLPVPASGSWISWMGRSPRFDRRGTRVLASDVPTGPYRAHSPGPLTPRDGECLDGTLHVAGDGSPWLAFCHEWVQVLDGEICAVRLSADLSGSVGD